ncbi:MAG: hypothetical protein OEV44_02790 [Spirochaetota bacterium]|nr:hypothetical protein [Spirochaetota bacterium]
MKLMSEDLEKAFTDTVTQLLENRYEPDKMLCSMGALKKMVLNELAEYKNQLEYKETKA